jgi:very-short-patch-repair endonuclease
VHADRRVAQVAARQAGFVTTAQLRGAGLSRSAVAHRVRTGRLFRWHRGVYRVGLPTADRQAAVVAALLAAGRDAAASHTTAAALLELLPSGEGPLELTVARREVRLQGVRAHTTSQWRRGEVVTRSGVRMTSVERTLLDLAATGADVERAANEALARRLSTRAALARAAATSRPGAARLRAAAGELADGFTRSKAERALKRLVRDADLPSPSWNVHLHGGEADAVWSGHRLVLEVDGFGTHGGRSAFERDRARDADRLAHGWRTMRVTWRQLQEEPVRVAARLAAGLASGA